MGEQQRLHDLQLSAPRERRPLDEGSHPLGVVGSATLLGSTPGRHQMNPCSILR
jgi:hypothetical protein